MFVDIFPFVLLICGKYLLMMFLLCLNFKKEKEKKRKKREERKSLFLSYGEYDARFYSFFFVAPCMFENLIVRLSPKHSPYLNLFGRKRDRSGENMVLFSPGQFP